MVRLNLLPPEIIEKRKFEKYIGYVILAAVGLFALLLGAWAVLALQVGQKNAELQDKQEEAADLRAQAEAYKIYEIKESELADRQKIAETALQGRVAWGRLANELSLVLPSDVWLSTLACDEEGGVQLGATAIDVDSDVPDVGHKAVAKTLVRVNELEQLYDVWVASSTKGELEDQPIITFSVSAQVHRPGMSQAAPAPPAAPGQ